MYVVVPKAFITKAFDLPWSELVRKGEVGEDGLRLTEVASMTRPRDPVNPTEFASGWDDWDSIAFVRNGEGRYEGKPFLFKQNW